MRWLRTSLRLFWGAVATLIIGFALFIQIGRLTLPLVSEWRASIEYYLSELLGHTVTLQAVNAGWAGLNPGLEIHEFKIIVGEDVVLELRHAAVQINLLRSLRETSWRFGRMEVHGLRAAVQQHDDGRWSLAGFQPADRRRPLHLNPLQWPLLSDYVQLSDIHLSLELPGERRRELVLSNLLQQNSGNFHRVEADLDLPGKPDTLTFVYEGFGTPGREAIGGSGYLRLADYPLQHSFAIASSKLADLPGVNDGLLSAELWFRVEEGAPMPFQGQLQFTRQAAVDADFPERLEARLHGKVETGGTWWLNLQDVQGVWQGETSSAAKLQVATDIESSVVRVRADRLDLGYWLGYFSGSSLLPEQGARILRELDVRGDLQNLELELPLSAPDEFLLRADLRSITLNDWKGAPGVGGLDGYIETSARHGKVRVQSGEGLLLHFPMVFDQPFDLQQANGEVLWKINPEANQVLVNSGLLSLAGNVGSLNGYFYLDAPIKRGSRLNELILQLGLQNGRVAERGKLMPNLLPDDIAAWIDRALSDGEVPAAGFALQGKFGRRIEGQPLPPRSIQLAVDVIDSQLVFAPEWPSVSELDGRLFVDVPELDARIEKGIFADMRTSDVDVSLKPIPGTSALELHLHGQLQGDASAAMALLTGSPLRSQVGSTFDDWLLEGNTVAAVDLAIPLAADAGTPQHDVRINLDAARLKLPHPELDFRQIKGGLRHSSEAGLQSPALSAMLWDRPVEASIRSSRESPAGDTANGHWTTRLTFATQVDFAHLSEWLKRPELRFLHGESPWRGALIIEPDDVRLQATTNLHGAELQLPAPYGKTSAELRALDLELPVREDGFAVHINYADQLFARLEIPNVGAPYGTIGLGQERPVRKQGIWIEGELALLDVGQWYPLLEDYERYVEEVQAGAVEPPAEVPDSWVPVRLDGRVERVLWDDLELAEMRVAGGQTREGWTIQLNSEILAGEVRLYDSDQLPEIDLEYLHWQPASAARQAADGEYGAETLGDRLGQFDPADLAAFSISVGDLQVADAAFGSWAFTVRPGERELLIEDIRAQVRNIEILGVDSAPGAKLSWVLGEDGSESRFQGNLQGENFVDVTNAWNLEPLMESRSIEVSTDLSWPGSPLDFGIAAATGDLQLDFRKGRFYQDTGQASSALLRLIGLFNFDNWARRLQLDFSDIYKGGLPFDRIHGELRFADGMAFLETPLEMSNSSSRMRIGGRINLQEESLDASLVATLPAGGNATLITALIGGLPAAAGVYLASKIFKKQVDRVASVSYKLSGPWSDPKVRFDKLFDLSAAKKAGADSKQEAENRQQKDAAGEPPPASDPG